MPDATQIRAHASELPGMIATLNSYESVFGPYHLQTLALAVQVAQVLWSVGEVTTAQRLSERSVKYLTRGGDQVHSLRMSALRILRDSLRQQGDCEKTVAVQKEIVGWAARFAPPDDPEAMREKAELARMLMSREHRVLVA